MILLLQLQKIRANRVAQILSLAILLEMEWSIGLALENTFTQPAAKILMARLEYIGVYGCVPFFFLFTIYYLGKENYITRPRLVLLFIIPVVMNLLVWTNDIHRLIWSTITPDPNPAMNILIFSRGPLYWLGVGFNYSLFIAIAILFIRQIIRTRGVFRAQAIILLAGMLPVVLSNLVYMFARGSIKGLDFSTVGFAVMSLLFYLGIQNQHLFILSPIPKEAILDGIKEGIVVLNSQNLVVDINPAALQFFHKEYNQILGLPIAMFVEPFEDLSNLIEHQQDFKLNMTIADPLIRVIHVECREIILNNTKSGRLVTFQDITHRKQMEESEIEQRLLAEAFRDVMVALTSTLDFEVVLDRIMENIHKVMPDVMTNLVLIDDQNIGSVVRCIGYENEQFLNWVKTVKFQIQDVATYRWMMDTGKPIIVPDTHQDPNWIHKNENAHSYMGAPIQIKGNTLGFINQDHINVGFFTPEQADRLKTFADLAAIALENARLFRLTQEMAVVDELTGLTNRRHFFELAAGEVRRSLRYSKTGCLVIFDIDHFKDINDRYGHPAGDKVLTFVAHLIMECVRDIDITGRYGGDEFCIFLPETDPDGARAVTQRVLDSFRSHRLEDFGISQNLTASFGIAGIDESITTLDELIARADTALYQAKQNGRDRIEVWQPRES